MHTQREVDPRRRYVFVIEKYIEDVKQEEKHFPDLVESIKRPPGLVKEGLRKISCKISQFRSKITKIRVCTFGSPEV